MLKFIYLRSFELKEAAFLVFKFDIFFLGGGVGHFDIVAFIRKISLE